jgi:acetyl esterase
MPVDPQFQPIIDMSRMMPPLSEVPLEAVRGRLAPPPGEPTPVAQVIDRTIPGPEGDIKIRIYRPHAREGLPLLLFMHGGGFILGDLDSHDEAARVLTMAADCVTVAVDYRLAPEYPFPAAPEDCYAALTWAAAHAEEFGADPTRIAVVGDSAGGNLAAVMALRARDEAGPALVGQVLIYPAADLEDANELKPAPDGEYYFLNREDGAYFNRLYLGDLARARHPHASPIHADSLQGLPPALVITAEYDPLCRQGEAFAEKLRQAGVEVEHTRYPGAIHGFVTMPVPMGRQALAQAAAWLKSRFATSSQD